MRQLLLYLLLAFYALATTHVGAQNTAYRQYIDKYADDAVDQMKRYGIPASITLAQALLESAAGNSMLARKANNHFGIKVGMNWSGPYVVCSDDRPDDRFRKYKSVADSYEDHSLFLKNGRRYSDLFHLKTTDYRGWAHGLKRAGYATNPRYAHSLIEIIERYDLSRYDTKGHRHHHRNKKGNKRSPDDYTIRYINRNYYVIAGSDDTFETISEAMGVSVRRLRRYNEVDKRYVLQPGDIVFLEKKQKRADKEWKRQYHTVETGESMHSIAQRYGMRMVTLYKVNDLPPTHTLQVGERLRIR